MVSERHRLYEQTGVEIPERDYPLVQTVDGFVIYITAHAQTSHPQTSRTSS